MDNPQVVNPNPDPIQPQVPANPTVVNPAPAPGDKTDPNLLLKSLQEEREQRRILEEQVEQLKTANQSEFEAVSDEGKALAQRIKEQGDTITELKQENAKKDVLTTHPILKDQWDKFEEFRENPENKGMNLKTAAKAYMIENGLLDKPRVGLENPTGGSRQPISQIMTAEDVKKLRETDYRKYQKMVANGQIPDLK